MELNGGWVAVEANDDIRRHGIELDTDDASWTPVAVPGRWQDVAEFAATEGPLMYRRRFRLDPPADGRRRWVTLDGIMYQADVWLDGAYLGDPEGYFAPHSFDVTALTRLGDDHVLAVEVTCSPQATPYDRRNITGILQPPQGVRQLGSPGGLWRPVHVYDTGPVRLDRLRVLCRDADERRAHLRLAARLDTDEMRSVTVRTRVDGDLRDEQSHALATGANELEWNLDVVDPPLWWPRALGEQRLVDVEVEVVVDGECSDRRRRRTGLRQVTWDNWICSVNGERLFLKGANLDPTRPSLSEVTEASAHADLELAVDLGLDAVRVHAHIAPREIYDAADELGLLVLQDFPLAWVHARSTRAQAVEQARTAVDALGHHPSIAWWNAHVDPEAGDAALDGGGWRRAGRLARRQLPSWNKTVLDRWVKRAFERADSTRHVTAHSGVLPHLPQLDGTDSHLWFGWRRGEADDLATFAARIPRMVRFVSEFGADSPSDDVLDDQLRTHVWPHLDWDAVAERLGYQRGLFERWFPPTEFASFEEWRATTQHYQAYVLRTQIETLRRLKYRPTGGFSFSTLVDAAPAISASVADHERREKPAAGAVRAACAPVLVVADRLPQFVESGSRLDIDVHVVNDLREPLDFAVVDAVASWPGGERRWRFGGEVPADDVVKVGRLRLDRWEAGEAGEMELVLHLTAGGRSCHSSYRARVTTG